MARSASLRLQDLRAIHCIVGECREMGDDPMVWRRHWLDGVAQLAGAGLANHLETAGGWGGRCVGVADWGWEGGLDRRPWVVIFAELERVGPMFAPMIEPYRAAADRIDGAALSRPDLLGDDDWYRSAYFDLHRQVGCDVMLYSYRPLDEPGEMSGVILTRPMGERDFSARQKAIVAEAHAQIAPLLGGPLARFVEPAPSQLPPRRRQVLRCLLEGDGNKQVAARLGISRHTANEHTKAIFRHFDVASRAELLARWVRRGWGARCAWTDGTKSAAGS